MCKHLSQKCKRRFWRKEAWRLTFAGGDCQARPEEEEGSKAGWAWRRRVVPSWRQDNPPTTLGGVWSAHVSQCCAESESAAISLADPPPLCNRIHPNFFVRFNLWRVHAVFFSTPPLQVRREGNYTQDGGASLDGRQTRTGDSSSTWLPLRRGNEPTVDFTKVVVDDKTCFYLMVAVLPFAFFTITRVFFVTSRTRMRRRWAR